MKLDKKGVDSYMDSLTKQIIEGHKNELLQKGQTHYCQNCVATGKVIFSTQKEPCQTCGNELVSLDNFR